MKKLTFFSLCIIISASCGLPDKNANTANGSDTETLFTMISPEKSNVNFENHLEFKDLKTPLQYINVYNGGGVAVGDINNDGLSDIYFTGNLDDNKLYLNKGDFEFEDITQTAGVACANSWSTGVTMVDINRDGWKDIYVCRAYHDDPQKRKNQLFINNKDLTFTEMSDAYGLGDIGYSVTANFLDYNRDGLLDLFIGNHPADRYQANYVHYQNWANPTDLNFSDRLFKNNGNNTFSDITEASGIMNYGWTLGAVVTDVNDDEWPDLFVTVDHLEPDRLYINNQNGTFTESSRYSLRHISLSSMGVDAGDINNDGLIDIVTAEMLAFNNYREKTQMPNMNVDQFWDYVVAGYNYQYMRNMLHLNNGNSTYREIAQMAGVHQTDWSWATLFMDMDNDGWKDLYITNGYFKDYSDKDYQIKFNKALENAELTNDMNEKLRLLSSHADTTKPNRLPNFMFRNNGDQTFEDFSKQSGLDFVGFSNGAAYADLDNDGDLDIVTNNINDKASLFRNNISEQADKNNWLKIKLVSNQGFHNLGSKIWVETEAGKQFHEHTITRGFQSSVEDVIHFGLGKTDTVSKIIVQWPSGSTQTLGNVSANQELTLYYKDAREQPSLEFPTPKLFAEVPKENSGIDFIHEEVYCPDYEKQVLLPHQMSCFGPGLSIGDINKDGLEDFYVGGAEEHAGAVFIQNSSGKFTRTNQSLMEQEKGQEDLDSALFDADGDGDLDLYIVSGGNEKDEQDPYYTDRFYLNDGKGNFTKTSGKIPVIRESGGCVIPFDYDKDGDIDLFVGSRHTPGKYPLPPRSYLLENNSGTFTDVTSEKAPALLDIGMVTDAMWTDLNGDGSEDLFIVGEWMPLTFLIQNGGKFENQTANFNLTESRGWWNTISKGDFDNDGDMDYAVGNLGLNYKYKSDEKDPFEIYAGDFDNNGSSDIVLGYSRNETLYPLRGRQCSSDQAPVIKEKFPSYEQFGNATLQDVYGDWLEEALHYQINTFQSSLLINQGDGTYVINSLPTEAQSSPVNSIISKDFDGDGNLDLLMAGNLFISEVETGRADSGIGFYLKGDGKGNFETFYFSDTGFFVREDVKDLQMISLANGKNYVLVANNHNPFQVVEWQSKGKLIQ